MNIRDDEEDRANVAYKAIQEMRAAVTAIQRQTEYLEEWHTIHRTLNHYTYYSNELVPRIKILNDILNGQAKELEKQLNELLDKHYAEVEERKKMIQAAEHERAQHLNLVPAVRA